MSKKTGLLFRTAFIVFAVGVLIAIPLRVYLLLYAIDPGTGFYYDNAKVVPALNVLLAVFTIALLSPVILKKVQYTGEMFSNAKVTAVFAFLAALFLCISFADKMASVMGALTGDKSSVNGDTGTFLVGLTAIFAGIAFYFFGRKMLGRKTDLRVLPLLPVVWGVMNLIVTFMHLTTISNISEYLYEVLQMIFCMIFLYYHAHIISGVAVGKSINGALAFGLPCALFGFLITVPRFIVHFISAEKSAMPDVTSVLYIIMSVYIIAFLAHIASRKTDGQEKVTGETA